MSYEPTQWKAGDTVTSAKLNKIEQGIANGGILRVNIHYIDGSYVLDKTWQQIKDAQFVTFIIDKSSEGYPVYNVYYYIQRLIYNYDSYHNTSKYTIVLHNEEDNIRRIELTTDNPDGYPSYTADSDSGDK